MKIWYDACTGKHIRYGATIANHFRQLGHEVTLTTRTHPDTLALAKILDEKFIPKENLRNLQGLCFGGPGRT